MTRLDSSEPTLPVDGRGLSLAVVVARFNLEITQKLLTGCLGVLEVNGAPPPRVVWVPGAFELPVVAQRLAQTKKYDAVIVLGCVIRGETPHDRYICAETARGVGRVALDTGVPVVFGVLTTLDATQARARSGEGPGNKGAEAAGAALEMGRLMRTL